MLGLFRSKELCPGDVEDTENLWICLELMLPRKSLYHPCSSWAGEGLSFGTGPWL